MGDRSVRRASTVCLVRDAEHLEVLMVQRPFTSRFMPGAWVFPGGAVDDSDSMAPTAFGSADDWKVAALRELIEETGVWLTTGGTEYLTVADDAVAAVNDSGHTLDPERLIYFSNWITPEVFPIRFDTRFFLSEVASDTTASVDGEELIDLAWVRPSDALEREQSGAWPVAFPTRETLKMIGGSLTARALVDRIRSIEIVPPIEPRLFVSDSEARILMPNDDGFDEAGPAQSDPHILDRLAKVVSEGGHVPAELGGRS
jgi:8-oxo-dGTP pyrophosphatase MutT (NUDIX family)